VGDHDGAVVGLREIDGAADGAIDGATDGDVVVVVARSSLA
jgi:hypothetical protein